MQQSIVTRTGRETYVTALIYQVKTKQAVLYRFFVPGWHPDSGGRKLIKAIKKHFMNPDETLIQVESCRCGYRLYELPLKEFIKYAKIRHVDKEHKEYTD